MKFRQSIQFTRISQPSRRVSRNEQMPTAFVEEVAFVTDQVVREWTETQVLLCCLIVSYTYSCHIFLTFILLFFSLIHSFFSFSSLLFLSFCILILSMMLYSLFSLISISGQCFCFVLFSFVNFISILIHFPHLQVNLTLEDHSPIGQVSPIRARAHGGRAEYLIFCSAYRRCTAVKP